jgi:Domain of unknown function (DUF1707)
VSDAADLRASDEERERVALEMREHFAAGRLSADELSDRLEGVYGARTTAQLQAARADLPALPASPAATRAEPARRRAALQRELVQQTGGGLAPFLVCTVIWAATGANGYFWPAWVALATLISLLRNGWLLYGPAPELDRVKADLLARREHGGDGRPSCAV